ncbi:hypothetical protein [Gallaecimonas sp. GXIMD4217]|uniref:hypothetical protein n=1 Tax=Gallaecimonas sp. GXIMD4217 TaxID=3131927 RepID=UPI00311B1605
MKRKTYPFLAAMTAATFFQAQAELTIVQVGQSPFDGETKVVTHVGQDRIRIDVKNDIENYTYIYLLRDRWQSIDHNQKLIYTLKYDDSIHGMRTAFAKKHQDMLEALAQLPDPKLRQEIGDYVGEQADHIPSSYGDEFESNGTVRYVDTGESKKVGPWQARKYQAVDYEYPEEPLQLATYFTVPLEGVIRQQAERKRLLAMVEHLDHAPSHYLDAFSRQSLLVASSAKLLQGMGVAVASHLEEESLEITLKSVSDKALDPLLFKAPSGYRVVDMAGSAQAMMDEYGKSSH